MFKVENLSNNDNLRVVEQMGNMRVLEYINDLSVTPDMAVSAYFSSKMNVCKRQLLLKLENSEYTLSSGAMQWMLGNIEAVADVKGVGDFLGKVVKGSVTGEGAVKPKYKGNGLLMLEPTFKHIVLDDLSNWGDGVVLDDGLFLACESSVNQTITARSNLSSAILGGEGLFNLKLVGSGIFALECPVPKDELIEVSLDNDVLKVDGNFAIAWSSSLDFTVEKSTKSLIGSAISAEGFVNVFRGTGKVLLAPIMNTKISTIASMPKNV